MCLDYFQCTTNAVTEWSNTFPIANNLQECWKSNPELLSFSLEYFCDRSAMLSFNPTQSPKKTPRGLNVPLASHCHRTTSWSLSQDNSTRTSYACGMARAQKHSTCSAGDRADSAREPVDLMCKGLLYLSSARPLDCCWLCKKQDQKHILISGVQITCCMYNLLNRSPAYTIWSYKSWNILNFLGKKINMFLIDFTTAMWVLSF